MESGTSVRGYEPRAGAGRGMLVGRAVLTTLFGLASWVVAAGIVSLPWFVAVLRDRGGLVTYPTMGLIAGALFGLANRSLRKVLTGMLAGAVGMLVAFTITVTVLFAFFHNAALGGWPATLASAAILSTVFCMIYGAATQGRRSMGLFALVALVVSVPFALAMGMMPTTGDDDSMVLLFIQAGAFGLAIGLATAIHQMRSAGRPR